MRNRGRIAYWIVALALALQLAACAPNDNTSRHMPVRLTATATAATAAVAAPTIGAITRTLRLADAPAACPVDAAWSPSGGQIAVLATRDTCLVRPAAKLPDLIIIFDAHSGAIVRQISLAATLAQAHAEILIQPMLGYSGLRWSPDGSKIAIAFVQPALPTTNPANIETDYSAAGALIVSVQKSTVRALLGPSNYAPDPTGRPRFNAATVWNVQTGALAASIALPLPAAERYQWSVDGNITPVSASVALSPANPLGSAQFSYWQPGFVAAMPTNPQSAGYPIWVYSAATFTRWSPNSQYVATALMTMNRAGVSKGAPTSIPPLMCEDEFWPQPCNDLPIPAPDAAFRAVQARVTAIAEATNIYPNDALAVWSPDGAVLATVLPGDDGSPMNHTMTLTLISAATGTTLEIATIPLKAWIGNIGMTRWPYVSWAPNGKQLAVMNDIDNEVEVVSVTR